MRNIIMSAAMTLPLVFGAAHAQDTLKIGYIDPLSGGGASVGEGGLKTFQYLADELNAKGGILGHKVEIVPMDNKTNPQESLVQAQKAVDAGIHYITQGNGSSVAAALEDFVTKNNGRNPGKEVLYFNYAAVDPSLTNEKCSFWHFRWDASSDIKMEALTNYMKGQPSIKKVYLINQDYSFGQSVRSEARKMLGAKRPDIEIVGDELHPFLKVTDFSPYVTKIKASGADTILTGNWGQDLALLLKAAAEGGLQARHSSRTITASEAPLPSVTETRAKPAPSARHADCRRRPASPTGSPLTNQRNGGEPPSAFSARLASRVPSFRPRSIRAPSGG